MMGFARTFARFSSLVASVCLSHEMRCLGDAHHPCSRDLQRLGHLSTHMKDAVFVLDQTHSKTHRLSHRLIPVRQDEAIELMDIPKK